MNTKTATIWAVIPLVSIIILVLLLAFHGTKGKTLVENNLYCNNKIVNELFKTILEIDSTFEYVSAVLNETKPLLLKPVFTEDSTKVLLTVNKYCGRLNGVGLLLILERIDNTWQVIYKNKIWVS